MIDQAKVRVGDKVTYQPAHFPNNRYDEGMVKEIPTHTHDHVRVVYNCNCDWKNFNQYTGALTHVRDLKKGWRDI